ncbi:hypothetical protein AB0O91_20900 [Kitasatospora sp. NPDC089797]|uniref:hypothetical protein n=1 Tax=Kitasatospora sp. NPDC089797 TaxID=3155298 RepID=UPI00344292EB
MKQRSPKSSILRKAAVLVATGCAAVLLATASQSAAPSAGSTVSVLADGATTTGTTTPTGTPTGTPHTGGGSTTDWNSTGG